MKKKILFIFHQDNFDGGASRSLSGILERLKKEKGYILLALVPKQGEISKYLEEQKIKTYILDYKWSMSIKGYKWWLKKIIFYFINKILFYKLYQVFKNEDIDLIYTNTSVISNGFYLSEKLKCKHIYHVREFGKEDHGLEYLYSKKRYIKELQNKNTKIITISEALKNKYEKMTLRKDIFLVYNGVNDDFVKKKYLKNENTNFLLIGSINKGKNQLEALKAIKELKKRGVENITLNFIGPEDPNYKKELNNYILENKLEKNVVFFGKMSSESIKEKINKSDVGLMLSLNEAFGRVTIEYMLGGLPIVASNTGANPELILNGENGYIYEIGNIKDLANKMEIFIKDFNKIEKIGKKARKIALKKYTADINYEEIKKIIKNI